MGVKTNIYLEILFITTLSMSPYTHTHTHIFQITEKSLQSVFSHYNWGKISLILTVMKERQFLKFL